MIKTSIEKISEAIGYDIGASDDETQANLLNGFCKGLDNSINTDGKVDLQICYIVENLTPQSDRIIKLIASFIETKEKNRN